MLIQEDKRYGLSEIARILGVSRTRPYKWVESGRLKAQEIPYPGARGGVRMVVTGSDLQAYMHYRATRLPEGRPTVRIKDAEELFEKIGRCLIEKRNSQGWCVTVYQGRGVARQHRHRSLVQALKEASRGGSHGTGIQ